MDIVPRPWSASPDWAPALVPSPPDSSAGVRVRLANPEDVEPLVAIRADAGRRAYARMGEEAVRRWLRVRASAAHVAALLARRDGALFVATMDDRPVGMAFVRCETRRVARLSDLYCAVPGVGAGSALLATRLGWALAHRATLARCTVFAANVDAQAFFHRRGFSVVGTEISDVVPGAVLLRFERSLRSWPVAVAPVAVTADVSLG